MQKYILKSVQNKPDEEPVFGKVTQQSTERKFFEDMKLNPNFAL